MKPKPPTKPKQKKLTVREEGRRLSAKLREMGNPQRRLVNRDDLKGERSGRIE